jgi:tartrate dehydratase alpha subunit/fumarate hydratase class I-like protein
MVGFIVLQLKHVILLRTLGIYTTTIFVISLHVAELPRHVQSINVMSSASCHSLHIRLSMDLFVIAIYLS